ncbi:MAG: HD domain-containing protein [Candidatus Margulisbacteria bacterium]|nr:HD domain-containing protein [Candidatus Margulisiibacteriota bacterium]
MNELNFSEQFWIASNNIINVTNEIFSRRKKRTTHIETKKNKFVKILSMQNNMVENLDSLLSIVHSKKLHRLFIQLVSDIYKQKFESSSIIQDTIYHASSRDANDGLKTINLQYHTFGTLNYMSRFTNDSLGEMRDYYLLAALAHDCGKSENLKIAYNCYLDAGHHKNSAEYIKKVLMAKAENNAIKHMLSHVERAIRVHHDTDAMEEIIQKGIVGNDKDVVSRQILSMLKRADQSQRQYEVANHLEIARMYPIVPLKAILQEENE